jgi:arsenate reductase
MAEAFLNKLGGDRFAAESAGLEPGKLNPLVIEAMQELGIDISKKRTKNADDFLKLGKQFDYVVTVCDEANAERCPFFPSQKKKFHWSFPDPSRFEGTHDEKLSQVRKVRDSIKRKVEEFVAGN